MTHMANPVPVPTLAERLSSLTWGGPLAPAYLCLLDASGSAVVDAGMGGGAAPSSGAAPGTSPSPSPATGGTGGQGGSAASPAAGRAPGSSPGAPGTEGGGAGQIDWNTAPQQLRDAYTQLKQQFDSYKSLGDPQSLTQSHQTYTALATEASTLGETLGYDGDEVAAQFAQDPVGTLQFLRNKQAQLESTADPNTRIQQEIEKRLAPVQQHMARQLADTAQSRFKTTVQSLITNDYKGDDALPPIVAEELEFFVSDLFKMNPEAVKGLVHQGKTAPIEAMYKQVKDRLFAVYNAMAEWEKGKASRAGTPSRSTPANPGRRQPEPETTTGGRPRSAFDRVADGLITGPERISPKYK